MSCLVAEMGFGAGGFGEFSQELESLRAMERELLSRAIEAEAAENEKVAGFCYLALCNAGAVGEARARFGAYPLVHHLLHAPRSWFLSREGLSALGAMALSERVYHVDAAGGETSIVAVLAAVAQNREWLEGSLGAACLSGELGSELLSGVDECVILGGESGVNGLVAACWQGVGACLECAELDRAVLPQGEEEPSCVRFPAHGGGGEGHCYAEVFAHGFQARAVSILGCEPLLRDVARMPASWFKSAAELQTMRLGEAAAGLLHLSVGEAAGGHAFPHACASLDWGGKPEDGSYAAAVALAGRVSQLPAVFDFDVRVGAAGSHQVHGGDRCELIRLACGCRAEEEHLGNVGLRATLLNNVFHDARREMRDDVLVACLSPEDSRCCDVIEGSFSRLVRVHSDGAGRYVAVRAPGLIAVALPPGVYAVVGDVTVGSAAKPVVVYTRHSLRLNLRGVEVPWLWVRVTRGEASDEELWSLGALPTSSFARFMMDNVETDVALLRVGGSMRCSHLDFGWTPALDMPGVTTCGMARTAVVEVGLEGGAVRANGSGFVLESSVRTEVGTVALGPRMSDVLVTVRDGGGGVVLFSADDAYSLDNGGPSDSDGFLACF